jgi:hypothetical protein
MRYAVSEPGRHRDTGRDHGTAALLLRIAALASAVPLGAWLPYNHMPPCLALYRVPPAALAMMWV